MGEVLVDENLVVLCVMAIQQNGMGVPASPSGVFRLRDAGIYDEVIVFSWRSSSSAAGFTHNRLRL